jgi:hypothetical protein
MSEILPIYLVRGRPWGGSAQLPWRNCLEALKNADWRQLQSFGKWRAIHKDRLIAKAMSDPALRKKMLSLTLS